MADTTPKKRVARWGRLKRAALFLFFLLLVVALLAYLYWPHRKSDIPRRFAQPQQALAPETSSLILPIKLSLRSIEADLNQKLPKILVNTKGADAKQDGVLSDVLVTRSGRVRLKSEGGQLVAYAPIEIEAKVYAKKRADRRANKGKLPQKGTQFKTSMELKISMSPKINADWSLQLNAVVSHRWTSSPTLRFGPFTFSVEKLADKQMKEAWPEVSKKVNAQSAQKGELRQKMEEVWSKMYTPQQLKEEPPTWLSSELEAFYASDPKVVGDSLEITVGVLGRFSVALTAPVITPPPPLPTRTKPPTDALLRLALSVQLPWEAMTETARAQLLERSWPLKEGGQLHLTGCSIYPSGDSIVVAVDYLAEAQGLSQEGTLYLQGRLRLDEAAARVQIEGFDYTLQTQDEVVLLVNDLVQSTIKEELQQKLSFSFGDKLEEARAALNQSLSSAFAAKGGTLEGEISRVSVGRLRMDIASLALDLTAEGALSLSMQPTPIKK